MKKFNFALVFILSTIYLFSSNQIVKVGYVEDYGIIQTPYIRMHEGFGYEYLKEIEKFTDFKIKFVKVDWAEGLEKLENGEIDIFGPARKTPDRLEKFHFTDLEFCKEDIFLISPSQLEITSNDKEAFNNLRIGVIEGDANFECLKKFLTKNDLSPKIVKIPHNNFTNDFKENLYDLRMATSLFDINNVQIFEFIERVPLYFMTNKNNAYVTNQLNNAMKAISEEHYLFTESLYLKYYSRLERSKESININDINNFSRDKIYSVGYHKYHHPASFTDDNDQARGALIDTMNKLAEMLKIKVQYIPHEGHDTHDPNLDFNLCMLENKAEEFGLSSIPYGHIKALLIIRKDLPNETKKTIASMNYGTIDISNFSNNIPNATVIPVSNMIDIFYGIKNGIYDGIVTSDHVSNSILNYLDIKKYKVIPLNYELPISIMISPNLPPETLSIMNKAISNLPPNFLQNSFVENSNYFTDKPTFANLIYTYRFTIIILSLLVISLMVGLSLYISIKHRKKLQNIIDTDKLTGTLSISKFVKETKRILATAQKNEYIIITFDIDNFKHVNELYGYQVGNQIIKNFGKKIESFCLPGYLF